VNDQRRRRDFDNIFHRNQSLQYEVDWLVFEDRSVAGPFTLAFQPTERILTRRPHGQNFEQVPGQMPRLCADAPTYPPSPINYGQEGHSLIGILIG
jgi:hypothetical protein